MDFRSGRALASTEASCPRCCGARFERAALRDTLARFWAHRQDGRAVMFIHPLPVAASLAHERAASFWEPDPGRPE
jgi:hypothetical protein